MEKYNEVRSLINFLLRHKECKPVSFHMPGHKGSELYRKLGYSEFLDHIMDCDITEIEGADNLFQPESVIRQTMERYRALYGVRKSYLLVNGTSCGLISAVRSTVKPQEKLIMARNCHKSVFNAIAMANIVPVYAHPELLADFGISGEIRPQEIKRLIEDNPDARAVILPSPNYYGICSDIEEIAGIVHEAGMVLIVDQAHGAHLKFFEGISELPKAAESCGADIVVNSIHKTLASFTQSAVVNVVTDRVNRDLLEDKLQEMESTSPSYLLMASLDINADILEKKGREVFSDWYGNLMYFYEKAAVIQGLRLVNTGANMDFTKINLDMSECDVSGHELEKILMENNIFSELVTGNIVMCMTGMGNTKGDFSKLLEILRQISSAFYHAGKLLGRGTKEDKSAKGAIDYAALAAAVPKADKVFEVPKEKIKIRVEEAAGRICAVSIIPYPPGIPLICPGEVISSEAIVYAAALRACGEKVMGIDEHGFMTVGK